VLISLLRSRNALCTLCIVKKTIEVCSLVISLWFPTFSMRDRVDLLESKILYTGSSTTYSIMFIDLLV